MRAIIISAVLAIGTVAVSCSRSGLETPPVPPRPNGTPVEVSLTTAPLETPLASVPAAKTAASHSKATASEAMTVEYGGPETKATSLTSEQEGKIRDLWVIQFDKASGALVGQPYYAGPEQIAQNGTAVSFEAKLTTASTAQIVYFVANTNSPSTFSAANCATETDMENVCRRIGAEYRPTADGGLPMLTAKEYPQIASGTPLTGAVLRRLVAKVVLRYKVSPDFAGFTLTGVRLRRVSSAVWYGTEKSGAVDFPAKNTVYGSESHIDYPAENLALAVTDGDYKQYTWYVPENLRKTVTTVSDERERTPDKTDGMVTYIEIGGDFKSPLRCERLVYKILLGDVQNDMNDYNVRRNRVYTATVTIQGRSTADKRVEVGMFDMNNSAMVVPDSRNTGAVTFDIRKLTKGWQTTLPTLGTAAALRAELLWTDNADLTTQLNIGLDKVNGLLTVKSTGPAEGNAVVALYDNATGGGNVLWSWHVWVTPYHPDGERYYGLPTNSKADVAGGQVHTYGTNFTTTNPGKVIMDRNLGATKAYYGAPAAGDATADQAYGLFYQWGRKDPFPGGTEGTTIRPDAETAIPRPIYGATGTKLDDEVMDGAGNGLRRMNITSIIGSGPTTLAYAIKNPLIFIYNTDLSFGDWYTTSAANQNHALWGEAGPKSAFDPCPAGWRVPSAEAWNDFTRIDSTTGTFLYWQQGVQSEVEKYYSTNGRLYTADMVRAWYPASGYRDFGRPQVGGKVRFVGKEGFNWSSTIEASNGNGTMLGFAPSLLLIRSTDGRCANGLPVRCIQE